MSDKGHKGVLTNSQRSIGNCPFLKKPFTECLCLDMDSQKTFGVLHYCQANFKECEIYQQNSSEIQDFSDRSRVGG